MTILQSLIQSLRRIYFRLEYVVLLFFFCFFLILLFFFLFNYNRLPILNKPLLLAPVAPCLIVKGGLEGLGDPELEAQHETPKATRRLKSSKSKTALDMERDSLSLSASQLEYQRQI
jgi:hypothetical protein